jgi:hypothetical protein
MKFNQIFVLIILIFIVIISAHENCVHEDLQKNTIVASSPPNPKERERLFQVTFQPLRIKFDYTDLDADEDSRQCTSTGQVNYI